MQSMMLPTGDSYWQNLVNSQSSTVPTVNTGATNLFASGQTLPVQNSTSLSQLLATPTQNTSPVQAQTAIPGYDALRSNPTFWLQFLQSLNQKLPDAHGFAGYNSKNGELLKECAEAELEKRGSTKGECAKGVRLALQKATGERLTGADAYKWADKLSERSDFKKVDVAVKDLKNLPAGAIVVWGETNKSPHGHISIADGNGNEISDHKSQQLTNLRGDQHYTVFIPV